MTSIGRKRIWVNIKLDGDDFANPAEFELRYALEDEIMERDFGSIEGAGSGMGWMDFSFEVKEPQRLDDVLEDVKKLLEKYHVSAERTRITVSDID
jgi:hypothetical protein